MASTYEPIASHTLTSSATSYTFTSVPSTFTDLVLVVNAQRSTTAENPSLTLRFNSDTGSNYSMTNLLGNGSSASSSRQSNQSMMNLSYHSLPSADSFATYVISIASYTNTNVYKTVLSASGHASYGVQRTVGLWRSTAAITSVTVTNDGSPTNFSTGCTFSLYGLAAA